MDNDDDDERGRPNWRVSEPHAPRVPRPRQKSLEDSIRPALMSMEIGQAITVKPFRHNVSWLANNIGSTMTPPRCFVARRSDNSVEIERIE